MKPFVPFASMLLLGTLAISESALQTTPHPLDVLKAQLAKPASESGILKSSPLGSRFRKLMGDAPYQMMLKNWQTEKAR